MISNWTLPFGGIKPEVGRMLIVQEQPSIDKLSNAGFYVFLPEALASIPNKLFLITELFESALASSPSCGVFLSEDELTDVGRIGDLNNSKGESLNIDFSLELGRAILEF